jgi:hypothetical protein
MFTDFNVVVRADVSELANAGAVLRYTVRAYRSKLMRVPTR